MSRSAGDSTDRSDTDRPAFAPAKLDAKLRREFLLQAGLLNAGILAGGAGLVLLGFTDELFGGILVTGLGITVLLVAIWRYRLETTSD